MSIKMFINKQSKLFKQIQFTYKKYLYEVNVLNLQIAIFLKKKLIVCIKLSTSYSNRTSFNVGNRDVYRVLNSNWRKWKLNHFYVQ